MKSKDVNDPAGVTAFIQDMEPDFARLINAIQKIILGVDQQIGEQIKWNSPSFFYRGKMKPFNPKEYKRDIVVINIRKGNALLIFPTGATIQDSTGILEGHYTDGRRHILITNWQDLKSKEEKLQKVINQWLEQVNQ